MSLYSCSYIENLINKYINKGGEMYTINEGCLGYGDIILFGEGLKTCIVNEIYINPWSSGHKIRFYKKMPKKYQDILNENY